VDPIQQQERLHQPTRSGLQPGFPQHTPDVLDLGQDIHLDLPVEPSGGKERIKGLLLDFFRMTQAGVTSSIEHSAVKSEEFWKKLIEETHLRDW